MFSSTAQLDSAVSIKSMELFMLGYETAQVTKSLEVVAFGHPAPFIRLKLHFDTTAWYIKDFL